MGGRRQWLRDVAGEADNWCWHVGGKHDAGKGWDGGGWGGCWDGVGLGGDEVGFDGMAGMLWGWDGVGMG